MAHKFKDQIIDWLNGGKYEYQLIFHDNEWRAVESLGDFYADEVRKVDEYKHLREALASGEAIQFESDRGVWVDVVCTENFTPVWKSDRYRIKPKTKKMVQWLLKGHDGGLFLSRNFYELGTTPHLRCVESIKPLPHTEIEVDCE